MECGARVGGTFVPAGDNTVMLGPIDVVGLEPGLHEFSLQVLACFDERATLHVPATLTVREAPRRMTLAEWKQAGRP